MVARTLRMHGKRLRAMPLQHGAYYSPIQTLAVVALGERKANLAGDHGAVRGVSNMP